MAKVLQRYGYEVSGYTNSVDALEVFRNAPERYDVLMTDLTMPEMNGVVLATRVHAIRQNMPVVLCSGYGDTFEKAMEHHKDVIHRHLKKPVSVATLVREIRQVLHDNGRHSEEG